MGANENPLRATLRGDDVADAAVEALELGATVDATAIPSPTSPATATPAGPPRLTVLPRRRAKITNTPAMGEEPRFQRVRTLGEGGMGHVELARDNDIRRTVAVKRLRDNAKSQEAVLRFADEVRIVGQLEHPAIVPVYDVGRDESGDVYLVMKHLDGETMEDIIAKLRAKDPKYCDQYSIEYRVHLFIAVLDAIRYAHARGIIHRDIKPANIMIGRFGEVTVLDWGIAKPIRRGRQPEATPVEPLAQTNRESHRLQETQLGALAGTPLYMSPEQAAGRNAELDERSDVYTLCVVLFEWLTLTHPLADKKTVTEALAATISGLDQSHVMQVAMASGVPAEWIRLVCRGLDEKTRYESVDALETEIRNLLEGRVRVQCHITLAKRSLHEASHWIDRHPFLFSGLLFSPVLALLAYVLYRVIA